MYVTPHTYITGPWEGLKIRRDRPRREARSNVVAIICLPLAIGLTNLPKPWWGWARPPPPSGTNSSAVSEFRKSMEFNISLGKGIRHCFLCRQALHYNDRLPN